MLKKFLLNSLSSFVGAWIALSLFIVAAVLSVIALIGGVAATSAEAEVEKVKSRSILAISLDGPISERESPVEPDIVSILKGNLEMPQTLDVIVKSIEEAAVNDDIVAIYLDCGTLSAGLATLDDIRHALVEFKKKTDGSKKIIAYAESFTQGAYFVASVADEIYLNPAGEMGLRGLASQSMYFKNLLDKLGVDMQVFKVGTYKSAVEPFLLTEMSEPARAQMDTLLNTMWGYVRHQIADSRKGVSEAMIDSLISKKFIATQDAEFAMQSGLVDSLKYDRQIQQRLSELSGREVKKLNFVSPKTLVSQTPWSSAYGSKKQIAVLFADGEIADGNPNQINYEDLVPVIVDLADNDNVKGLVLRVNSPGGAVFGSTLIGEALDYFQSKGKPLAVSMGDYAASGGYWISSCANKIFADPMTITGSIGIFGMIPNFKGSLDKIGINVSTVATNADAIFPDPYTPMTAEQKAVMQSYIERGYDKFTSRVAKGRKMTKEQVYKIAEGRVWSAESALKIGLVDSLDYLQAAIEWTANEAKIGDNYDVAAYPKVKTSFWNMVLSGSTTMQQLKQAVDSRDEDLLRRYLLTRLLERKSIQARMPEFKIYL